MIQGQLLTGLAGFRELTSPEAKLELRDGDGDAVPFPMMSEPLVPARYSTIRLPDEILVRHRRAAQFLGQSCHGGLYIFTSNN